MARELVHRMVERAIRLDGTCASPFRLSATCTVLTLAFLGFVPLRYPVSAL